MFYNSRLRAAVCQRCERVVDPHRLVSHLARKATNHPNWQQSLAGPVHQVVVSGKTQQEADGKVVDALRASLSSQVEPGYNVPEIFHVLNPDPSTLPCDPFEGLPVYEGWKCAVPGCYYSAKVEKTCREHCKQHHAGQQPQVVRAFVQRLICDNQHPFFEVRNPAQVLGELLPGVQPPADDVDNLLSALHRGTAVDAFPESDSTRAV